MLAPTHSAHTPYPAHTAPAAGLSAARMPRPYDPLEDDSDVDEWSEEELVYLHWRLLEEVKSLADPEQPLDEKFDTLRWIFTEPANDDLPFSFAQCVRVAGCSPLSPIPYCGQVDVEELRDQLRSKLSGWLNASLERYPIWLREALIAQPDWIIPRLSRNPQWINEQLKRIKDEGDLFA